MEGYWLTHYDAGSAHGDGIAMLHGGELVGGDLEHIWTGTYEEEDSHVYARIRIVPFVSRLEEESMAREKPIIMSLQGSCTEESATLDGHPDQREDLPFHVVMRKCKSAHGVQRAVPQAA